MQVVHCFWVSLFCCVSQCDVLGRYFGSSFGERVNPGAIAGAARSTLPPAHNQDGAVGYRVDGGQGNTTKGAKASASTAGGGWDSYTEGSTDISARCDIDERLNITAEEFYLVGVELSQCHL
jgi:hypothetical protein